MEQEWFPLVNKLTSTWCQRENITGWEIEKKLLSNPKLVTPRLLFELYTFNYQRTLFEKLLNDKIDDALRVINANPDQKQRRSVPNSTELNLDVFIELLNLLDSMVCFVMFLPCLRRFYLNYIFILKFSMWTSIFCIS